MKRIALSLMVLALLTLSACGSSNIESEESFYDETESEEITFTEAEIERIDRAYLEFAINYSGLVKKVEPRTEDYKEIYIMINEEGFNFYNDNEKQGILDDLGNTIENGTRDILYPTSSGTFEYISIYFVDINYEPLFF